MSKGKSIRCSMVKIVIAKKIVVTHKYVVYLYVEICISRTNSIKSLAHFILSLLSPFPHSPTFLHHCCCVSNFHIKKLHKAVKRLMCKCKALLKVKIKCISITMYSLVMSPFSRGFIKNRNRLIQVSTVFKLTYRCI